MPDFGVTRGIIRRHRLQAKGFSDGLHPQRRPLPDDLPQTKLVQGGQSPELGLGLIRQSHQPEKLANPRPVDTRSVFHLGLGYRPTLGGQIGQPLGDLDGIEPCDVLQQQLFLKLESQ